MSEYGNKQVAIGGDRGVQTKGVNEVTAVSREVASIQAQMMLARQFPRNVEEARMRIMEACKRPGLAFGALYKYAKGKKDIEGPSIRLAEEIARCWGNIEHGIRELEQTEGESVVEAYAWDLQTNTRQTKRFTVAHIIDTKDGGKVITDSRSIYELVANMGARRVRNCILGMIPTDIVDEAVAECKTTQAEFTVVSPDTVAAMAKGFQEMGVTIPMIEARIQRNLSAIEPYHLNELRNIFQSIRDGVGDVEAYFDTSIEGDAPQQTAALGGGKKKPMTKADTVPKSEQPETPAPSGDENADDSGFTVGGF